MSGENQRMYEELAERYDRKGEGRQRDVFLVLAADAAFADGRRDEAERLRQRLLHLSPHNLLRPFSSFAEAVQSSDVRDYILDLRRQFPLEQAEDVLKNMREGGSEEAEVPVFKLKELLAEPEVAPRPRTSPPVSSGTLSRRGRRASKSPYDVAGPDREPSGVGEGAGGWIAVLLFIVMLVLVLGLGWYVLVRPALGQ